MSQKKKLNENAKCFDFGKSKTTENLKSFFKVLFTSWDATNVDSIVSSINIPSLDLTELFLKEMFVNIYELSSKSATNLKADNVIITINTMDTILPEVLIEIYGYSTFVSSYTESKKKAFQECFNRIKVACNIYEETKSTYILEEIKNVSLILTKLSEIRYFHLFVYQFGLFLWEMVSIYQNYPKLREIFIFCLSGISNQLVVFLLYRIDNTANESNFPRDVIVAIFDILKDGLIQGKFNQEEIKYVLNILDRHDRFIGQYFDAVPENILESGYILCSSQTRSLENDEVYDDFEKFILDECG